MKNRILSRELQESNKKQHEKFSWQHTEVGIDGQAGKFAGRSQLPKDEVLEQGTSKEMEICGIFASISISHEGLSSIT